MITSARARHKVERCSRRDPRHPSRALDKRAQVRYLAGRPSLPSPRDQALAVVPFCACARISEIVARDISDVAPFARKGILRIYGKGERVRQVGAVPLTGAT
jgi:site-specific recombinase XerC